MSDPDERAEEAAEQTELEVEASEAVDSGPLDPAILSRLERIVEALLLASDTPLSVKQLHKLLGVEFEVSKQHLRDALAQLGQRIAQGASELREVSSGYRIHIKSDYAEWVGRLWQEKPPRYSRALLETLALICYRQPITRGEIEDIRGVAVSTNILRTLSERGWIRELGVKEVPGRPMLFGTTHQFLDDFNLRSLDELPSLPEIKDADQLDAALARLQDASSEVEAMPLNEEADQADSADSAASADSEQAESNPAEPSSSEPASDVDPTTVH